MPLDYSCDPLSISHITLLLFIINLRLYLSDFHSLEGTTLFEGKVRALKDISLHRNPPLKLPLPAAQT